eukprot:NODE_4846_length_759_cov_6.480282_g4048_i0.p3 GENE.NODE_4846_length_759_cov_6.480282_g4048_i0~~NODE_4846_length_759_cov_6.480282_g4048_i0.p3  ORF type:complete len:97 (-),score=1.65 NODE_4846_length_759_cov_6.480282_g4048_i0:166-456(-)
MDPKAVGIFRVNTRDHDRLPLIVMQMQILLLAVGVAAAGLQPLGVAAAEVGVAGKMSVPRARKLVQVSAIGGIRMPADPQLSCSQASLGLCIASSV